MNNWREYEAIDEEYDKETPQKFKHTKKKKTWKQITEVKNDREHTKKQWQKKRRVSKNSGDK